MNSDLRIVGRTSMLSVLVQVYIHGRMPWMHRKYDDMYEFSVMFSLHIDLGWIR